MARYFFHLQTGRRFCRDEEGVEISTLDDLLLHAADLARRLIAETSRAGATTRSAFAVEDGERRLILHLSFASLDNPDLAGHSLDSRRTEKPGLPTLH
jgi:hypothetical protein